MKHSKLVLAYSGGLDTSYSLRKLSKEGYEVHAVSINTGGFSENEIKDIEEKYYQMGAHVYKNINAFLEQEKLDHITFSSVFSIFYGHGNIK